MKQQTFSVVVESGTCDQTRRFWEEKEHCGHNHKTYEAAERCKAKLTKWDKKTRTTSARWYNARIHNQDHERIVDASGITEYEYRQQMAVGE